MTKLEYEMIQDKLRKKLSHCDGLTGKRKEGYETAMKEAMSVIHSFKPDKN